VRCFKVSGFRRLAGSVSIKSSAGRDFAEAGGDVFLS
jgi:hypothetical protein